jgi:hypothetical protein
MVVDCITMNPGDAKCLDIEDLQLLDRCVLRGWNGIETSIRLDPPDFRAEREKKRKKGGSPPAPT